MQKTKKIQANRNVELEQMKKFVRMLNSGSSKLDQILTVRKLVGDRVGLGYIGDSS